MRKVTRMTRRTSQGSRKVITMVAGKKLIICQDMLNLLGIDKSDIGNPNGKRLEFGFDEETGELLIFVAEDGFPITGKSEKPEIYCSSVCNEILKKMGKVLVGFGTVRFSKVTAEESEGEAEKCLVVDIQTFQVNQGVLSSLPNETTENLMTDEEV